jgi:hypothetical protein
VSDDTYSLLTILGTLAAAAALWFRFRRARLMKQFLRSLAEQQAKAETDRDHERSASTRDE